MGVETAGEVAEVENLYLVDGKAEIVSGKILREPPTGYGPHQGAFEIAIGLREYQRRVGGGIAFADNCGFVVDVPNRRTFSPDAAWFTGTANGMKFVEGAPDLAVEVRSEHDYGPAAEARMAAKRADYFAAGTLVVWDVDLLGQDVVRVYRQDRPETSTIYRRGDRAEAEPAVPGWTMAVDRIISR